MKKKARVASIGVGMIGQVHAQALAKEQACDYVAICDVDASKKELADSYGVAFYRDFTEMIEREDLDGVVVAVPNHQHAGVGVDCAEHGLHVFMEKPIAPSIEESEELIKAAARNNVKLAVGHHRRFNPLLTELREIIRRGELGRVVGISMLWGMYKPDDYFVQGPWRKEPGGGPILINLIHEIDNLRYTYGEIVSVYAEVSSAARGFTVEDTVGVTIRMKDNAIANVLLTDTVPSIWAYEQTMGEFDFFYQGKGNIYHFFGQEASLVFPEMIKVSYPKDGPRGWQHPVELKQLYRSNGNPYPAQMHHFCNVTLGLEEPRTTGEDALQSLRVAMGVAESGLSHKPVVFDV